MPANKNAVTRYYIIDKLLANRYRNYSVADIRALVNEELEEMGLDPVSIRTIQYDIDYMVNGGPFLAKPDCSSAADIQQNVKDYVAAQTH